MYYRMLGKTEIKVSEIGFGTWGLGGDAYGPVDTAVCRKTLECALEAGVNFFDTSDLYGQGRSEELLGQVFRKKRDKVIIATKGGMLPHSGFTMPQDFSEAHLRKSLETSLRRLQTDYVDVYQLHSPHRQILQSGHVMDVLEDFRRQGKIRTFGLSARSPSDALWAIENFSMPVVQVNFNLLDQRALDIGLFARAEQLDVGIIVRTPLVFGFLTGGLEPGHDFADGDHRANWPLDQRRRWIESAGLFSFLWHGKKRTQVQAALRFVLDHRQVSTVIPGMLTCGQVEEDVQASQLPPLEKNELERIYRIYNGRKFYDSSAKQRSAAGKAA